MQYFFMLLFNVSIYIYTSIYIVLQISYLHISSWLRGKPARDVRNSGPGFHLQGVGRVTDIRRDSTIAWTDWASLRQTDLWFSWKPIGILLGSLMAVPRRWDETHFHKIWCNNLLEDFLNWNGAWVRIWYECTPGTRIVGPFLSHLSG